MSLEDLEEICKEIETRDKILTYGRSPGEAIGCRSTNA
jgi:hypothetical protein